MKIADLAVDLLNQGKLLRVTRVGTPLNPMADPQTLRQDNLVIVERIPGLLPADRAMDIVHLADQVVALPLLRLDPHRIVVSALLRTIIILTRVTTIVRQADLVADHRILVRKVGRTIATDRADHRTIVRQAIRLREVEALAGLRLQEAVVHQDQDRDPEDKL